MRMRMQRAYQYNGHANTSVRVYMHVRYSVWHWILVNSDVDYCEPPVPPLPDDDL